MHEVIEPFYVGPWLVEPKINRIRGNRQSHRVEPKVMGVLVALSRNPGEVVTREQLFEEVWSGTVVTDDVLTRSISELRKVFEDDRRSPGYIETIQKTGYRLIAPVAGLEAGPQVADRPFGVDSESPSPQPRVRARSVRRIWLGGLVLVLAVAAVWSLVSSRDVAVTAMYPTPVTTYPGRESPPKLSPDGRQVAFSWRGEGGGNLDLYVKYVDAAPVLRLTSDSTPNANPAWSPNGTEIAFVNRSDECRIKVISAIGGSPRTIGSCGASIYGDLNWSPDGAWLAFNDRSDPSESFAIHLMSPVTGEKHRLTDPPTGIWGDHDPVFSPDGDRIAFVRSASEGMQDVFLVDASGQNERRLSFENRNVWGSAWMEDGDAVILASNRAGRPALWRVDVAAATLSWLGVQSPAAGFPSIAGDRLAFLQMETDVNLWRVPLDSDAEPRPFAASTYWDLHPAISPDGTQVAFSSNRSGSYEIWVADSSGGSLRKMTNFGGPFTSTPRWSPDGSRLVFTGRPEGNADVFTINLNAATPERITTSPADDLAPDWFPDGQSILFTSNRSGAWEIWRHDLAGDASEQVTHSGGFGARPFDGNERLGFSRPSQPGLWTLETRSGRETEIVADTDPRDWGSWAIAGSALYYLRRGSPNSIMRLDLDSGRVDTVFQTGARIPAMDPAMAVSPDGRWLLLGQVDREESDVMIVELGN